MLNKIKQKWYNKIEGTIGAIIVIGILLILTVQVIARYLGGYSFPWIDEVSRYGLIWLAYFAAVYAIVTESHIKVDILLKAWPKKVRRAMKHIAVIIFFVYCVVVAYYSALWVFDIYKTGTISLGLHQKMAYFQCVIPISHALMAIRLIQVEVRHIKHPEMLDEKTADQEAEELLKAAKAGEEK